MGSDGLSLQRAFYGGRRRIAFLWREATERPSVHIGSIIVTAALVTAALLHLVERLPPEGARPQDWPYTTYLGTLKQVGILLLSGFDVAPPRSPPGFILALACVFLGVALIALLTADLASVLIQLAMTRKGRRPVRARNHVVICGWHYTAKAIVDQLTSRDHKPKQRVVVVDPEPDELLLYHPDVEFVRGDATEQEPLELARTARARTALIPLDFSYPESVQDSRTTLAVMAVKAINPEIYACVELLRPSNRPHVERTAADEIVCVGELSQKLLSQAALAHGISRLFDEILTFNRGSEIHRVPLPDALAGRTFRWLLNALNEHRDGILLAVHRDGQMFTNPQGNFPLQRGDALFVLAERPPRNLQQLAAQA